MNLRFGYTNVLGQNRGVPPLQICNDKVCTAGHLGTWKLNPFWVKCAPGLHPVLKALTPQHQTRGSPGESYAGSDIRSSKYD